MTDLPEKKMLRVDEAADYFDVHPKTIRRWIEEGRLPAEKLAGSIRIPKESILNFRTHGREAIQKV
ncbi:MAG: helix-turn-helix domain-containing protein [Sphaerochaeta sp.]|nr:helix-turn-helix domain-containing protein [Sphaerochaeta sp.]